MDAKQWRLFAQIITVFTGLLLVGILPAFGVQLAQNIFGALSVGVVLGFAQFVSAWAIWKKKF